MLNHQNPRLESLYFLSVAVLRYLLVLVSSLSRKPGEHISQVFVSFYCDDCCDAGEASACDNQRHGPKVQPGNHATSTAVSGLATELARLLSNDPTINPQAAKKKAANPVRFSLQ